MQLKPDLIQHHTGGEVPYRKAVIRLIDFHAKRDFKFIPRPIFFAEEVALERRSVLER
jgi:hypothetical protein